MGRNIKVTGTKVGSDGSGYFRGNDGKHYYGNPQNGYLTETEQSRRAHAGSQAAPPARSYSGGGGIGGGGGDVGIIEVLFAAVESAVIMAFAAALFLIALAVSIIFAWPNYINLLAEYYQRGQADLMVIMMSAVVIFLIGYFLWSVFKVCTTKRMRSRRYIIVCAIAMVVPAVPVGLFLGQLSLIPSYAFQGIVMSVFPAFILCWVEHVATKEIRGDSEWFISKIARLTARVFPFHSIGMIVFGVFVLLGGVQYKALLNLSDITRNLPTNIMTDPMTVVVAGILFIIMGIIAKKKGA